MFDLMEKNEQIALASSQLIYPDQTLQKNIKDKESFIVANGFLPGTDGRKMSKTWDNAIWLEDAPEEIYGKVMSIADDIILTYYLMGTNVEQTVIDEAKERLQKGENPMNLKKELAKIIVSELHGEEQAKPSEEYFENTVVKKIAGEDTPVIKVDFSVPILGAEASLAAYALANGLVSSNSEFKTLLKEGAIYLMNKLETQMKEPWEKSTHFQTGRTRWLPACFSG